ncbi:hypothetical protein DSLASN_04320 [Desulfoluna limicola]|uniref:DUF2860 domain-containing protein n=1 Tax=Desulfoluna limicola TaxID=2810562 RepID=A0ABM7PC77_9BACT|nr:DUF2860 family protein [Desulfoluna limicola]BCS94800.1 hypothetical protein DSLASN_04320 [Desulfoluna limicola]
MKKSLPLLALAVTLLITAMPAHAIQPMPEQTGFSGFINVGAGVTNTESNMMAGNGMSDSGSKRIDSLTDSPSSDTNAMPVINFDLNYTFADTRTQIFAGNRLEDLIRFDTSSVLGIRQELPDKSSVRVAYAFTSFPSSVWQDPYVTGVDRKKTDRTAEGLRLGYDKIMGSRLEAEFTWRKINIDTERSGEAQTQLAPSNPYEITAEQAKLLDRNGSMYTGKLTYPFAFQQMRHIIIPTLEYTRQDLDGEAMAFKRYGMMLSYALNGPKFNVVTNIYCSRSDYDEENPIYGAVREDDILGASFSAFYKQFLGVPQMNLVGTIASYHSDSNIDFYDSRISMGTVSVMYRF